MKGSPRGRCQVRSLGSTADYKFVVAEAVARFARDYFGVEIDFVHGLIGFEGDAVLLEILFISDQATGDVDV